MKLLIIGGSGGLSGCLAKAAIQKGHSVWTVTRGQKQLPEGVHGIYVDRNQEELLEQALLQQQVPWDAVLDCICMNADHAHADLRVLSKFTRRLVVISTDSVYDPRHKQVPQTENSQYYEHGDDYAGNKRKMEEVFLQH